MEDWTILVFVGLLLTIWVVIGTILSDNLDRKREKDWAGLVESLPDHQPNAFELPNQTSIRTYRDREIKLAVFRKYSPMRFQKTPPLYKSIQLPLANQLPVHLEIHKKGLFKKTSPQQVGDKEIDNRFYIDGWPQEFVRETLTSPAFRNRLLQLNPHFVIILGNELYFEERYASGPAKNVKQLENLLGFLCDLADLVEEKGVPENPQIVQVREENLL